MPIGLRMVLKYLVGLLGKPNSVYLSARKTFFWNGFLSRATSIDSIQSTTSSVDGFILLVRWIWADRDLNAPPSQVSSLR